MSIRQHISHLTPLISWLMKYTFSVHLLLDTTVLDPIASQRPLKVPRQLSILAAQSNYSELFCIYFSHSHLDSAETKLE